jgi:Recombinase zinc beta ribbon domain
LRGLLAARGIDAADLDWLVPPRASPGSTRWTDKGGTQARPDARSLQEVYRKSGRRALWDRPAAIAGGHGDLYLLSGLLLCGECGWGLHATHRTSRRGENQRYYVCTAHRTRGNTVCRNAWSAPMEGLHQSVITSVQRDILAPDLVHDVVKRALELRAQRKPAAADRWTALQGELDRLEAELRRYADAAIGAGEPLPAILEAMRTRERRRQEIHDALAALTLSERQAPVTTAEVYRKLSARLTNWQGALERHPERSREILRGLLVGRLVVSPKRLDGQRWFEFRGEASCGALVLRHNLVRVVWRTFGGAWRAPDSWLRERPLTTRSCRPACNRTAEVWSERRRPVGGMGAVVVASACGTSRDYAARRR